MQRLLLREKAVWMNYDHFEGLANDSRHDMLYAMIISFQVTPDSAKIKGIYSDFLTEQGAYELIPDLLATRG